MRIGIVGYGAGGKYFHAPFIEAADGVELVGIVARSARKRRRSKRTSRDCPSTGAWRRCSTPAWTP